MRCPADFEWVLFGEAWAREKRSPAAALALAKLIDRILPNRSQMYSRRYTFAMLLEANEFVATKAFVHAIILMSKWLGEARLPLGVHYWPPPVPAELASAA